MVLTKKRIRIAVPAKGELTAKETGRENSMARTRNVAGATKRKGTQINLRLTSEEKRKLEKKSMKCGLSLSEYIRIKLFDDKEKRGCPEMVASCAVLCQDILNIITEKYRCEDNALLEEKVEELWKFL